MGQSWAGFFPRARNDFEMLKLTDSPLGKGSPCQVQRFSLEVYQSSKQIPTFWHCKTQTFLQACFESAKAMPVIKAAAGAEAVLAFTFFISTTA